MLTWWRCVAGEPDLDDRLILRLIFKANLALCTNSLVTHATLPSDDQLHAVPGKVSTTCLFRPESFCSSLVYQTRQTRQLDKLDKLDGGLKAEGASSHTYDNKLDKLDGGYRKGTANP